MNKALTIRIRRHQHLDKDGNPIIVTCNNNVIGWSGGTIDASWYDATDYAQGLDEFQLVTRQDITTEKKREATASLSVTFTSAIAELIKSWLLATDCDYVNYFDCEITDNICGIIYNNYELKADNLEYCSDFVCSFTLSLRESDTQQKTLRKLSIHDNWQKWFTEDGGKNHPTFQVVIQKDITSMGMQGGSLLAQMAMIDAIPGVTGYIAEYLTDESYEEKIKRVLGFGYYAPAPRIYDILLNACQRSGITMDTPFNPGKALYNDCLLTVPNGTYHTDFDYSPAWRPSPSQKFIESNAYTWPVNEFLDELCRLYNMKWDVINGVLKVEFNQDLITVTPAMTVGNDYDSICYEYSLNKKPAYGRYEYGVDGGDFVSGQVQTQYNDNVDYDPQTDNPMLEGDKTKQLKFAPTGFYCDSFGEEYLNTSLRSMKVAASGIVVVLAVTVVALFGGIVSALAATILAGYVVSVMIKIQTIANQFKSSFGCGTNFSGIIRVSSPGIINLPRVIRYDPSTPLNNAKVVKQQASTIPINTRYNTESVSYANNFSGTYTYQTVTNVYNYPLFFDSFYKGNLYDTYHEKTDSPIFVNFSNKVVTAVVPMCCEYLNKVGLENGTESIVGKIVEIPDGSIAGTGYKYILVTEVTVDYQTMSITIKGQQIYR